jgi:hypothetical protein
VVHRWIPAQGTVWRPRYGADPTDRGRSGWKWPLLADRNGIPFGQATTGANRHHGIWFAPTLDAGPGAARSSASTRCTSIAATTTAWLVTRFARFGIDDVICAEKRVVGTTDVAVSVPLEGAGRSNGPTVGCRTSVSSAASPTAASNANSHSSSFYF